MDKQPSPPLDYDLVHEVPPMTPNQLLDAYKHNRALFDAWYFEQRKLTDAEPTSGKGYQLSVELSKIQHAAGDTQEALETLNGANEAVTNELIEVARAGSPLSKIPDKEAYQRTLKSLLQQIIYLRSEFRR